MYRKKTVYIRTFRHPLEVSEHIPVDEGGLPEVKEKKREKEKRKGRREGGRREEGARKEGNELFIEDDVVLNCVGLQTASGTCCPQECWSVWGARAQAHAGVCDSVKRQPVIKAS